MRASSCIVVGGRVSGGFGLFLSLSDSFDVAKFDSKADQPLNNNIKHQQRQPNKADQPDNND